MTKIIMAALLASAALSTFATTAVATETNPLKLLFESLNTRDVSSQAGLTVPQGYKVKPTADAAPVDEAAAVDEPFTEVKTSGYIKAGYIFSDIKDGTPVDKSEDIDIEAGVNVKGSVQSSIGEIGVTVQAKWDIAESATNAASIALRDEGFIGFWQFSDALKLETGRSNAGRLENGIDKNTKRLWTFANRRVRAENAGSGFFDRDMYNGFFGLAYASGPLTFSARVHDATRGVLDAGGKTGYDDDAIGASAKALFTSEMINLEAAGGYWGQDDAKKIPIANQKGVKWLAGVGTELNFIPGIPLSIGAQMGELHNGAEQYNVSASLGFSLTDTVTAGLGAGMKKVKNSPTIAENRTEKMLHAEIYYAPMAQLLLGLEADLYDDGLPKATSNDGFTGALVTRYSF